MMVVTCVSFAAVHAGLPLSGGEKILFIGNSLTANGGGLDNHVRNVLAAGSPSIQVTTESYIEYATELIAIYNNGAAADRIRSGGYNYVVLQGWNHAENVPEGGRTQFIQAVVQFDQVIRSTGAQTLLYMHFPGAFQADLYSVIANAIADSYDSASAHVDRAPVAPCGLAWRTIFLKPPAGQSKTFLYADDIHQNEFGHVLNSYVFYMTLTGKSPIGLQNAHPAVTIDRAVDSTLQFRAWQMVTWWDGKHASTSVTPSRRLAQPLGVSNPADDPAAGIGAALFMVNGRKIGFGYAGKTPSFLCVSPSGRQPVSLSFPPASRPGP